MDALTTDPQIPQALVTLTDDGRYWQWRVLQCPFCGQEHVHGAGPFQQANPRNDKYLGVRVALCELRPEVVYLLVEKEE